MPDDAESKPVNLGSGAIASHGGVAAGAKGIAVGGGVEGGIHYHEAPETPILHPTPPAPPAHFTGRAAELERLVQLLTSGESVAITALQGMGGIGKTALAQKLAERLQGLGDREGRPYFPGGVLWWSLGPQPDVFTALDVWARHADPRSDLSALPDAESRANVVRAMLSGLGKLLAIIDDVWQAEAARTLMSAVPPDCPVLITTRDGDIAKALRCRVERIDTLSEDEAVALLAKLLGLLGDCEPAAREIARLTEGMPLALELIYGLADLPADLPALAKKLRDKPALGVLKLPGGERREESVEACLALSYTALDAEMQRRFRSLAVFALAPFDRDAIAAVWGEEDETVEQAVQHLTRRNLLTLAKASEPSQGYTQHALLHAYALALLNKEGEYTDTAARHADYYGSFAEEKDWHAVEKAFEQIDWGWRWVQAHAPTQIIGFVSAVQNFLNTRGRKHELIDWLQAGLEQARTATDRTQEGTILNNIGLVYSALGQKRQALDTYQRALTIHREVGNRLEEGTTLNNIGLVYSDLGQKQQALDTYQQALAIRREVGDRGGEGTTLNNIGVVYDALGRKQQALEAYQQALTILREVGDRGGEGSTVNNIGRVYDALGQKQQALDTYQQALAIQREVGDRSGEGTTLNNIAGVYDALGQKQPALDTYQQALAILREVGDRSGEGATLNNIGVVYDALGQNQQALEAYQQALTIAREVSNRSGEGATLNNIGRVYDALGQKQPALDTFQQALAIHREVGNRPMEGTTLTNIGSVYSRLGQKQPALETYQQALAILREVGDRWTESITLFNIGVVLDAMGLTAEAISYLEQNVALDEAIGHPNLERDRAKLEEMREKMRNG